MKKNNDVPLVITDLDGTLVNVMDEILADLAIEFDVYIAPEDCKQYDIAESFFPLLDGNFKRVEFFREYLDDIFKSEDGVTMFEQARPYWRLHQLYRHALEENAIELVACTGRHASEEIQAATEQWLGTWGYEIDCIFATDKVAAISDTIRPDDDRNVWLVEDNIETAQAVKAAYPDIRVFIVDRPWTKDAPGLPIMEGGVENALAALCPPPFPSSLTRR